MPDSRASGLTALLRRNVSRVLLVAGGALGIVVLLLIVGYPRGSAANAAGYRLLWPGVLLFIAEHAWTSLNSPTLRYIRRRRWPGHLLLFLLVVQAPLVLLRGWESPAGPQPPALHMRVFVISLQAYLLAGVLFAGARLSEALARIRLRPAGLAFLTFLTLILSGALGLLLPNMSPPGQGLSFIDALFTATSACCVTGLTVVDTSSAFTTLGQAAVMILIQLGGLGIMVLAAFLGLAMRRDVGLRERAMLRDALNLGAQHGVPQTLGFIVGATLICELIGAAALYACSGGPHIELGRRAFDSLFHSVSAFCNAGFSTHALNLEVFQRNPVYLLTITLLLVLGGFGFVVLSDCTRWLRERTRRHQTPAARLRSRLSVQSKMVLSVSLALLAGGWILFLLLEWHGALAALPWPHRLVNGLFMAATPRTAGFNCTSPALWSPPTILMLILLMVIGGAPGSTAGGSKVTTVGVIVATLSSMVRGREFPVVFRREIPLRVAGEALVVLGLYLLTLGTGTFILLMSEGWSLQTTAFEAASALGTVGLSLGATVNLSVFGKLVVCALMLIGRLGPLTVALALARQGSRSAARYPEERVMIG